MVRAHADMDAAYPSTIEHVKMLGLTAYSTWVKHTRLRICAQNCKASSVHKKEVVISNLHEQLQQSSGP